MARIMAPLDLAFLIAVMSSLLFFSSAELERLEHPIKDDGSLSFLAVGDWGRNGTFNQSQVAYQMGRTGEELDIDFVVSVGDNFYENGFKDVHDTIFEDSFTNIYTAKGLQKQWYAILGNHDYRGDVLAQLDPLLQKIDNRWLCKRSFIVNSEVAELFFVDTSPFVKKYWNSKTEKYDWRGVAPRENYIKMLLEDLDSALSESTATWKIVLGHHTMRSVSDHGDTVELVEKLLPILESNGVDLYINGHDHCLEHISSTDSPLQFVTSGGGSKAWRGVFNPTATGKLKFFYDGQGFISLQLTRTEAKIVYYDVFGAVLYQWSDSKELKFFV